MSLCHWMNLCMEGTNGNWWSLVTMDTYPWVSSLLFASVPQYVVGNSLSEYIIVWFSLRSHHTSKTAMQNYSSRYTHVLYLNTHTYTHIHTHKYVHTHGHTRTHTHRCMCIHTHARTHARAHTHTHTQHTSCKVDRFWSAQVKNKVHSSDSTKTFVQALPLDKDLK